MPPILALLIWFIMLLLLLRFDPAKEPAVSSAIWVPVIWMFILGSRLTSQWLGTVHVGVAAASLEEGNAIDRVIGSVLTGAALAILVARSFDWAKFIQRNLALCAFIAFAMLSVIWSDFMFVALKRWFRDLGNYLMALVVLTDSRPLDAVRTLLRFLGYLLLPLSVVLIKYYPQVSKTFSEWTGAATVGGAATDKNMLGIICLVTGIFFFWDTLVRWPERRKNKRIKRVIWINFAFIGMILWLLNLANSATSMVCLLLGCAVITIAHAKAIQRRPLFLKWIVPLFLVLCVIASQAMDNIRGVVASSVGRDPTFTDRSVIWATLLKMKTNPIIGTGYESFWLGPRLLWFWDNAGLGRINSAHNGYLEIYLNLGLIGLLLMVVFIAASYRNICRRLAPFTSLGSLMLSVWTVILFHSITEASFRSTLLWAAFLLAGIAVPTHIRPRDSLGLLDDAATAEQGGIELKRECVRDMVVRDKE